jgi:hypothetical protein
MEQILSKTDKTIVESGNVMPFLPLPEIQRRAQHARLHCSPFVHFVCRLSGIRHYWLGKAKAQRI